MPESIADLIAKEPERFVPVLTEERFCIWEDIEYECFYCREQGRQGEEEKWYAVAYVAAMQKQAWDDWAFDSAEDEDNFTDTIAFCPFSGEVTRDGQVWLAWFDILHRL